MLDVLVLLPANAVQRIDLAKDLLLHAHLVLGHLVQIRRNKATQHSDGQQSSVCAVVNGDCGDWHTTLS